MESEINEHVKDVLTDPAWPHTWWSALKQSLPGVGVDFAPSFVYGGHVAEDPTLTCFFEIVVTLRLHCLFFKITVFSFRSYGGTDSLVFFLVIFQSLES